MIYSWHHKTFAAALVFMLILTSSCRSMPDPQRERWQTEYEAISDPLEEPPPEESDGPPTLSMESTRGYAFSHIPSTPENVRGNLYRRPARDWRYIVIHHSGTESGSMKSFDREARENRGWKGVGYHFVIGNGNGVEDGKVEVTFRWAEQMHGAHAGAEEFNEHGIGICLVGNFENAYPTEKQLKALASLTAFLQERNDIPTSEIYLHRHIKNTACPGENFPFYKFISLLER